MVVGRDQPFPGLRVDHRLVDRVEREQGVAREVHLGDHPLGELGAEQREVDVRGAPRVAVVAPGIGAGLDRGEPVDAVASVRQRPTPVKFGSSGAGCWSRWWM